MARRRRVLILYGNLLFGATLKSLLEKDEGLEVVTVEAGGHQESQVLRSFRPNVVIVDESVTLSQDENAYIHDQVYTVIRLSLKDGAMRVSREQQISSAGAQDLLMAIRGRGPMRRGRRQRQDGGSDTDQGLEVQHG